MCGITGFIGFSGNGSNPPKQILKEMTNAIYHRGPDAEGHWINHAAELALGHRRLSIVELSSAGQQPMHSPSKRYTLVFNGEIYNHIALRKELSVSSDPIWRGNSDTETLLAGFDFWGIELMVRKSVGMFAMAIWDNKTNSLTLVRDRMGEKPLYYGWQGKGVSRTFMFSSELKALRVHPAFENSINRAALAQFVKFSVIRGSSSIYRGLKKVLPGTMVVINDKYSTPKIVTYWSVAEAAKNGAANRCAEPTCDIIPKFEDLLRGSIQQQMIADVPFGAFLSGGIDSSTVVALMQAQSIQPIKTFSIGFSDPKFNEAIHARAVAKHLGTDHTDLYLDQNDVRDLVPKISSIFDEPFADSSALPTFLVCQLARKYVKVALTGDGGDELFCGYKRYYDAPAFWNKIKRTPLPFRSICEQSINMVSPKFLNFVGQNLGKAFVGDKVHKAAKLFSSQNQQELYQDLITASYSSDIVLNDTDKDEPLVDFPDLINLDLDSKEHFMLTDLTTYLPDTILTKVDRTAMAVGLETRVPFLDHRVVEFALKQPLAHKFLEEGGMKITKWLIRQVLYQHVPRSLVDRDKMGFSVPLNDWLRGPLKDWAEELLNESALRNEGFFDASQVRKIWSQHLSGHHNLQTQLWAILMFQTWRRENP